MKSDRRYKAIGRSKARTKFEGIGASSRRVVIIADKLSQAGALAIPGIGPFIAAVPVMAALSGVAVGAATGGVIGGLIGLGIPEIEAKRYEEKLKKGNYLIAVHTDESEDVDRAKDIFKTAGAEDISTVSEASAPKVN